MQDIFALIKKIAPSEATVLIYGESGTGKELVARAIHAQSKRRKKPLVPINCSSIPESLMESELFGYEKGSFTGANSSRVGRLEVANRGTLFIDEVGDLFPTLQVKLLRFLQEKEIEKVGGRKAIGIDVRIIAATNKNLKQEIVMKRFREDLYFRLNVIPIFLPPLRERGNDILLLVKFFLKRFRSEADHKINGFEKEALLIMQQYDWPGNVREMENRIRRGIIVSRGEFITANDLGFEKGVTYHGLSLKEARNLTEKKVIVHYLRQNKGNISQSARQLKISRPTLHELIKKHCITPREFKFHC